MIGWSQRVAIAFISASLLSFEVTLTRVFAIEHEFHLSAFAIALALLGFGVAGTSAALLGKRLTRHSEVAVPILAFLTVCSIPLALRISNRISLNLQALPWNPAAETINLALVALSFAMPFFFGALFITVLLMKYRDKVSTVFSSDLWGSAAGAVIPLLFIGVLGVKASIWFAVAAAGLAGFALLQRGRALAGLVVALSLLLVPSLSPSEHKAFFIGG